MIVKCLVAYEGNLPGDVYSEGGETKLLDLLNRRAVAKQHDDAKLVRVARPAAKEIKPANADKADAPNKGK